ncbi:MAG: hypothetical protein JRH11_05960 [Deltaproteobacteria bacterium]|nr:hypothetical protein [Deltaproteobacteria bacterium]
MAAENLAWVVAQMPHQPPMRLIDEVVSVEGGHIQCRSRIQDDHILLDNGRVSALAAIELFAQAAAALMVYRATKAGVTPTGGYLLGTRKVDLEVDYFLIGDELTIDVNELWGNGPLAQFECSVAQGDTVLATGSINVAAAGGPPPEAPN